MQLSPQDYTAALERGQALELEGVIDGLLATNRLYRLFRCEPFIGEAAPPWQVGGCFTRKKGSFAMTTVGHSTLNGALHCGNTQQDIHNNHSDEVLELFGKKIALMPGRKILQCTKNPVTVPFIEFGRLKTERVQVDAICPALTRLFLCSG
jgi:hypothetical protein